MKTTHDYRKDREQWAKSLRDRAESRRERAKLDDLRDERLERQLQGHMARAAGGDEKSLAWLKRRHDGIMLARAYGAGMGRKHTAPDGWSESDGKYYNPRRSR